MKKTCLLCIVLFLLPTLSFSKTITGKVIKVTDGDRITILTDQNEKIKILLQGIDSPEKKQAYGQEAKNYITSMVAGKTVTFIPETANYYGRTAGIVYINDLNLNDSIVAAGYAWVFRKYCRQGYCEDWLKSEAYARLFGFGLWAAQNPKPPWEWRKAQRNNRSKRSSNVVVVGSGIFHGNAQSLVLHSSGCQFYYCKNCTIVFKSVQAGLDAGYRPHKQCIRD